MAKRKRVPEILWRLYKNRARTLAEALAAFVPDVNISPEICRCQGGRCLRCADTMSFLLRPNDPIEYRRLLTQCFVVVNQIADPLYDFSHDSRWSQRQILEKVIEIARLKDKQNVICAGYEGASSSYFLCNACFILCLQASPVDLMTCNELFLHDKSSSVLKCLTSSAWNFLHGRIGDDIMVYLLRFASIFLPLPGKKYQQVAGPPTSVRGKDKYDYQASKNKRKRNDNTGPARKRQIICPSTTVAVGASFGEVSNKKLDYCANQTNLKPKRHFRLFRWFRPRDTKHSNATPCTTLCTSKETLVKNLQHDAMSLYRDISIRSTGFTRNKKQVETKKPCMCYFTKTYSPVLPRKHVLNTLKANFRGSVFLMVHIFGKLYAKVWSPASIHHGGVCLGASCLYHSLHKSLKTLIRRAKASRRLRFLLDKHCPVTSLDQNAMQNSGYAVQGNELRENACKQAHDSNIKKQRKRIGSADLQSERIRLYCTKSQVVSFIWDVCILLVPRDLLGTASNQRILRRNIAWFIARRKHEKCSAKQLLHKLKTSNFPVFSDKQFGCMFKECIIQNNAIKIVSRQLCLKWICWLFLEVIKKLVLSNFHVTESQHGRQSLYFYRKCTWKKLAKAAIDGSLDGYVQLEMDEIEAMMRTKTFGFSKIRLVPKANGVRMVANLRASSKSKSLCNIHAVFKEMQIKEPEKLGSTVFDYNDAYGKLCPFLTGLRNELGDSLDLFIVVADVSKAFDSINQNKLLDVMQDVLNDEYSFRMCSIVHSGKRSEWVKDILFSVDEKIGFTRFIPSNSCYSIIVERGESMQIGKTYLIFGLKELLKKNLLQLNNSFYRQRAGIPQGNKLSSMLCSLYYGHLERNVVYPFLEGACLDRAEGSSGSLRYPKDSASENMRENTITFPTYILLRFLDDILFISTSRAQAASFFIKLQDGFPEYNCFMNKEKFCTNFEVEGESGCSVNRMYVGADGISFIRWSGLLINSGTLEVQADYTRYWNNHLSSTLTVSWGGKLVDKLRRKLRSFMMPKCHPILLDSNINSQAVVKLNIYQAFLLAAMKFHCYLFELSRFSKLRPKSLLCLISQSTRYMYRLIRRRMLSLKNSSNVSPVLKLHKREVVWLGLNAFIQVLSRKQTRYQKLLVPLRSELSMHMLSEGLSSDMLYAIDETHSSALWRINY